MSKKNAPLSRKEEEEKNASENTSPQLMPMKKGSMFAKFDDLAGLKRKAFASMYKKKSTVSQPADPSEMQADAVAKAVTEGNAEAAQVELQNDVSSSEITAKASDVSVETPPGFEEQLEKMKGGGLPLPDDKKGNLEEMLGADLSDVRLHTGSDAAELANAISAEAFASGKDIVYPGDLDDEELLAHEVAHTVQGQAGIFAYSDKIRRVKKPYEGFEDKQKLLVYATASDGLIPYYGGTDVDSLEFITNLPSGITIAVINIFDEYIESVVEFSPEMNSQFKQFYEGSAEKRYYGYIKKSDINAGLREYQYEPEYYKGDISKLADHIYQTYIKLKPTFESIWGDLASGIDSARTELLNTIPDNLSFIQREELKKIFLERYNLNLMAILYNSMRTESVKTWDEHMINSLRRVSGPMSNKSGYVQITGPTEKILPAGMDVIFRFETIDNMATVIKGWAYEAQPHIYDWVVRYPNGKMRTRSRKKRSVTLGEVNNLEIDTDNDNESLGTYAVYAIVDDGTSFTVLSDYFEICTPDLIGLTNLQKLGDPDPNQLDYFRLQFAIQKLKLEKEIYGEPSADKNQRSDIKIKQGENPVHVYQTGNQPGYNVRYQVLAHEGETSFMWYVIPTTAGILPTYTPTNFAFFPLTRRNEVHDFVMEDGTKVYSPQTELKPGSAKEASVLFPAYNQELGSDERYLIVCEKYDDAGALKTVSTYDQYLRSFSNKANLEKKADLEKVNEQIARIDKFAQLIEGKITPVAATYINLDTGNSVGLHLYYGTDKKNPKKTRLLDLTIGSIKSDFIGDTIEDAFDSFYWRQSYPDGYIYYTVNDKTYRIKTNGGSLVERFSTWTGWLSTLFLVAGVVTAIIPGTQELSPFLFQAGFAIGAVSAGLDIANTLDQDKIDWVRVSVDIGIVASSVLGAVGSGYKIAANAKDSLLLAGRAEQFYMLSGIIDVGDGLIATAQVIDEINIFLETNQNLPYSEKQQRLTMLFFKLMATGGLLVLSAGSLRTTKVSLKNKGVPDDMIKNLDQSPAALLMVDQLTASEIANGLKRKQNLVTLAKKKQQRLRLEAEQKDLADAIKRHKYGNDLTVRFSNIKKVALGGNDLSNMTLDYRKQNNLWHDGNIAIVEYFDETWEAKYYIQTTLPETGAHAERLAIEYIENSGVPAENITRLYSELEPCELTSGGYGKGGCKKMLFDKVGPDIEITYSYDYPGHDATLKHLRDESILKRKQDFEKIK